MNSAHALLLIFILNGTQVQAIENIRFNRLAQCEVIEQAIKEGTNNVITQCIWVKK